MSDRLQPALWGGVFIGVLSALPLVNLGNCCCCLWVLAGGALAAYLRQQGMPYQIAAAEGALVGLMAGVVGAIVSSIISIPLQMAIGPFQRDLIEGLMARNPDMPPELREAFGRATARSGAWILGLLVTLIVYPIFALLGGLLGAAMFKKDLPPPPPPGTIDVTPVAPPPPPPVTL
jgi:hypothetical protein